MSRQNSYHHGDLRQAIIDAACRHLRLEHPDSLSLRALAREIGVSQTAPYRHFDSRNALFAAIAASGFRLLEQELLDALNETQSVQENLIQTGLVYLEFAEQHAEKYQLFYDNSLVDFDEYVELQEAGVRCFDLLLRQIRLGIGQGVFKPGNEEELCALFWSGLHGMASLRRMPNFVDAPVAGAAAEVPAAKAINYLDKSQREAVTGLLRAILR